MRKIVQVFVNHYNGGLYADELQLDSTIYALSDDGLFFQYNGRSDKWELDMKLSQALPQGEWPLVDK